MKSVIVGNGVNIKFGGSNFSNYGILSNLENGKLNINEELKNDCLPGHKLGFWPVEVNNAFVKEVLCKMYNVLKSGEILSYLIMKKAIEHKKIKNKVIKENKIKNDQTLKKVESLYKESQKLNSYKELGLEEYLFLLEVYGAKIEGYETLAWLFKIVFNILIFNKGKINDVEYNNEFIEALKSFDKIFTLNYDHNIEKNTGKQVRHLHGDFDTLSCYYDEKHPIGFKDTKIEEYRCMLSHNPHYYANTIYAYSGNEKYKQALGIRGTNKILTNGKYSVYIEVLSFLSQNDRNSRTQIEIEAFLESMDLSVLYEYYFDELKEIKGDVHIFGLAPNNDNHIFDIIKKNKKIDNIIYYFYNESDKGNAQNILQDKRLILLESDHFTKRNISI